MRSITRHRRRIGLLFAVVVVGASGFLLAGPGLDTIGSDSTVPEPPPTVIADSSDDSGLHTDAGPNPWAANDLATLVEACVEPFAFC